MSTIRYTENVRLACLLVLCSSDLSPSSRSPLLVSSLYHVFSSIATRSHPLLSTFQCAISSSLFVLKSLAFDWFSYRFGMSNCRDRRLQRHGWTESCRVCISFFHSLIASLSVKAHCHRDVRKVCDKPGQRSLNSTSLLLSLSLCRGE